MVKKPRSKSRRYRKARNSRDTSYRIPNELWDRVRNAAAADGRTVNGMVIDAMERYRHQLTAKAKGSLLRPEEASAMRRLAHEAKESIYIARLVND
jgi:hypothetical protein